MDIAVEQTTKAEALVAQLGWQTKKSGADHLAVECCPFCHNQNYKFYIQVGGEQDGCSHCKVCGKGSNYYQLKQHLAENGAITSLKAAAAAREGKGTLPDFDALHARLMSNGEVLDYLVCERKLSVVVIKKFKLGCATKDGAPWVVIPYFDPGGKPVYYKARSVPPAKKAFDSPAGFAAPLFNEAALKPGLEELVLCEGEGDTLALLSQGVDSVVGVPGAGVRKADWIEKIDKLEPKKIYLIFDNDAPGQEGARELAARIGLDKVYNVVLPEFQLDDDTKGKDVNDWFKAGRTLPELRECMAQAKKFDVAGVQSFEEIVEELEKDLTERGSEPKYKTPWPSLNKRIAGFEDGDLVGWLGQPKHGKSSLILNQLYYHAAVEGHTCLCYCLEMPPKRILRKLVSHMTQTPDDPVNSKLTVQTVRDALSMAAGMPGDILFGYTKDKDPKTVFDTIRQAVRRHGVKVVSVDHLHLLVRSVEHQAQEIGKLIIDFKNLAMELGILLHLIVQPNRVAEGQVVNARNVLGSSMVEKMVDYLICIHRNPSMQIKQTDFRGPTENDTALDPLTLLNVALSRYSAGGYCTLYMEGDKSTFREIGDAGTELPGPRLMGIPVESNEEVEI